ncbi:hypothetical protein V2J09_000999 [Rumex salicifolius]
MTVMESPVHQANEQDNNQRTTLELENNSQSHLVNIPQGASGELNSTEIVPANTDIATPKIKKRGGQTWAFLLLANQGLATLAFFGVGVNLVLFLTRVMEQNNADAANNVSKWTGTVYLFSLLGAFLSDSYWGRYLTCAVFQVILVLGLVALSLASWLLLIEPKGCGTTLLVCKSPSTAATYLFYLSIYMVALGYGGHQPTLATFGADQFDESDPKQKEQLTEFYCYFYFALNVGSLFSNTILVYYEDVGYWTVGFLVSMVAALLAFVLYMLGTNKYRYIKATGNPVPRVAQVFVASFRKWKLQPASPEHLYETEGAESSIKGCRKIIHSTEFEFFDKAATVKADLEEEKKNPWKLCTVTQVEEAKCVMKMLPIWLCTIIYSVIFTQMASLFVEQGDVMDTRVGKIHIPAASMSVFDICAVLICTFLYRKIVVPVAGRISGHPNGLTELQRMGAGLIIGILSMVAAGFTEIRRLSYVVPGQRKSELSVFWQVPQYALVGASEVFMYVGQLEFFNGQAPDGIKSFGSSLCMASISFGNYVSSILVKMVTGITAKGGQPGWIPEDLNAGHMDRFYFLIAVLTAVDLGIYILCARWYTPIHFDHIKVKDVEMDSDMSGVVDKEGDEVIEAPSK